MKPQYNECERFAPNGGGNTGLPNSLPDIYTVKAVFYFGKQVNLTLRASISETELSRAAQQHIKV